MNPVSLALLILAVPLVSVGLIALFFPKRGGPASVISTGAAGLILVAAFFLVFGGETFAVEGTWLAIGDYSLAFGILYNDLTALMLFVVAVIGFFVHLFSLKYMENDPGKARFFAGLSLFMFSMLGIVFADNLLLIFVFWELVGLSSYLLINHWFERPAAVAASKKAFLVNRIGDIAFLIGIIWCYWQFGTLNLLELAELTALDSTQLQTGLGLLLFCGAVAKSGQVPLHVWLPDAMEGPTPVSALIHAATMVAAGIYLLCRIWFLMAPGALELIAIIGTVTAILGAATAIVQTDIKKILAYSTISQLGYMVAAFGLAGGLSGEETAAGIHPLVLAGGAAAMFHLTTHAFFKALLFLGSGSIIHACKDEQNIYKMGGLRQKLPLTFAFFTIGYLALIGFPFLAGFFSKDAILYLAWEKSSLIFWVLGFTALLTAFYMTRLWLTVFFGEPKSEAAKEAQEGGPLMTIPLGVLAVGALFAGWTGLYPKAFAGVLEQLPLAEGTGHVVVLIVSLLALVAGFGLAWMIYGVGASTDRLEKHAGAFYAFLEQKFYFDTLYEWYVEKVQQRIARLLSFLDQILVAGVLVRGAAGVAMVFGVSSRASFTGNLHHYVYWFFLGILLLTALSLGFL